ncbi:M4 family metallopeptidase [Thermoactinomyces sp. CICC 10522]|uniref:M4 family metallopeptidase n=1 Tax=Thermoactinomyces sp. CICC 10522 TaxID=2767427 RepID=UPI0018DD56DA|nr:M4 family metallopeptidase [Thermoactinomyces sp. CICC 10522]MBH8605400.1 peptidase M4 family protein [Thermoactinomyces sp. CICC 10522]
MKKLVTSAGLAMALVLGTIPFASSPAHAAPTDPIKYHKQYKTPTFMGKWNAPSTKNKQDIVWTYLNNKKNLFKIRDNVQSHFQIIKVQTDELGMTHYRVREVYKGIPVYGSDQTIHVQKNGDVASYFGQFIPELENKHVATKAEISREEAIRQAETALQKEVGTIQEFVGQPSADLYIYPYQDQYKLTYLVKMSTVQPKPGYWFYFIDATNGSVINKFNAANDATGTGKGVLGDTKTFDVTYSGGYYYLDGTSRGIEIATYDAKHVPYYSPNLPGTLIRSSSTTFSDPAAVDAHAYAERVYDYYKNTFGRNSYDNKGAPIISSVHVGNKWNNAAWIGTQMVYGDGDGTTFRTLSGGLDVIGHELTHAVTQSTADLIYQGESGALNESISDIFGAMIDSDDWDIGEDVYTPGIAGDALRSMSDPTKYGDPDNYANRYTGPDDNGGVHTNSGINNKAAYLMAQGGSAYGVQVSGIGRAKTANIYYRALNYYLYSSSNFSSMRQAAIQAATDLYGANSAEVNTVKNAYSAVGVY